MFTKAIVAVVCVFMFPRSHSVDAIYAPPPIRVLLETGTSNPNPDGTYWLHVQFLIDRDLCVLSFSAYNREATGEGLVTWWRKNELRARRSPIGFLNAGQRDHSAEWRNLTIWFKHSMLRPLAAVIGRQVNIELNVVNY